MDAETARWVAGVAIGVVLGLIGLVWGLVKARQDNAEERTERVDGRLSEHVKEDIRAHERLTAVETIVSSHDKELRSLRNMRHEIIEETSRSIATWYTSVIERVTKMILEMRK